MINPARKALAADRPGFFTVLMNRREDRNEL